MLNMDMNTKWLLRSEKLNWGAAMAPAVLQRQEGWLTCHVPCDIHMPLIEHGVIAEPLNKGNSLICEWTEDKSWWFKKNFDVSLEWLEQDIVELTFEALDCEADVFLNGFHLGKQRSSYYPFMKEVKKWLQLENNVLLVRLTAGTEYFNALDVSAVYKDLTQAEYHRGDNRLPMVRKPVYVFGFDWAPRVVTCGIVNAVHMKAYKKTVIRSVNAATTQIAKDQSTADILLSVEFEGLNPISTSDGMIQLEMLWKGKSVFHIEQEVLICSGLNYIDLAVHLKEPHLWWPNGMGEANLYEVRIALVADQYQTSFPPFRVGVRTLKINQDRLNPLERLFYFEINGIRTFCKGGNWIPPDSIYARVTAEKYNVLILEAKAANFNMLRVWGGGIYEVDLFYELCDEHGLLVWQDSMFACYLYPDHLDWFRTEVENELNYQTRRLRRHPCLAIWSGNNENQWGFEQSEVFGGLHIYNQMTPRIIRNNCPHIPYWNSSPYGGLHPNDHEMGDTHHWFDCMMHTDMEKRITPEEFDKVLAKFVSEFGYPGAPRKSSIEQYHDGEPIDRNGNIWSLHNNTYEKNTVLAGIAKHYIQAEDLTLEQYIHYSGLCQGLMLGYALEALRYKKECSGGLFWMYNDTWGEIGWTIVDYYLRRKISYYYVKRAFQPLKFIMRKEQNKYIVIGINETSLLKSVEVEYGFVSFDGQQRMTQIKTLHLAHFSREVVMEWDEMEGIDLTQGCYFLKAVDKEADILPVTFRSGVFRELAVTKPSLRIYAFQVHGSKAQFHISSGSYAHAVHFKLDDRLKLSDEYFDLLPDEVRILQIANISNEFLASDLIPHAVYN